MQSVHWRMMMPELNGCSDKNEDHHQYPSNKPLVCVSSSQLVLQQCCKICQKPVYAKKSLDVENSTTFVSISLKYDPLPFPDTDPVNHNDDGKEEEQDGDPVDPVHILHEIRVRAVGILFPEVKVFSDLFKNSHSFLTFLCCKSLVKGEDKVGRWKPSSHFSLYLLP